MDWLELYVQRQTDTHTHTHTHTQTTHTDIKEGTCLECESVTESKTIKIIDSTSLPY